MLKCLLDVGPRGKRHRQKASSAGGKGNCSCYTPIYDACRLPSLPGRLRFVFSAGQLERLWKFGK
jgi:hypothetical protein